VAHGADVNAVWGGTYPIILAPLEAFAPRTLKWLLDRGADLDARDAAWDSPPLDWAMVGSGEQPGTNPRADWVATVQALLDAGADPGRSRKPRCAFAPGPDPIEPSQI